MIAGGPGAIQAEQSFKAPEFLGRHAAHPAWRPGYADRLGGGAAPADDHRHQTPKT